MSTGGACEKMNSVKKRWTKRILRKLPLIWGDEKTDSSEQIYSDVTEKKEEISPDLIK